MQPGEKSLQETRERERGGEREEDAAFGNGKVGKWTEVLYTYMYIVLHWVQGIVVHLPTLWGVYWMGIMLLLRVGGVYVGAGGDAFLEDVGVYTFKKKFKILCKFTVIN